MAEKAEPLTGLQALKRVWRPFVLIQSLAVVAVVTFYVVPGVSGIWEPFGAWKSQTGYLGSALATILASLGIPEIARRVAGKARKATWQDYAFEAGFFASIGVIVDWFYRQQAAWFGTGVDFQTLATKLLVDQLAFGPLISIPMTTIAFAWRESRFSFSATRELLTWPEFNKRAWSVLVTCWAFWVPVLCCVYAMPPNLQIPLYLFTQAAWSLLIVTMQSGE